MLFDRRWHTLAQVAHSLARNSSVRSLVCAGVLCAFAHGCAFGGPHPEPPRAAVGIAGPGNFGAPTPTVSGAAAGAGALQPPAVGGQPGASTPSGSTKNPAEPAAMDSGAEASGHSCAADADAGITDSDPGSDACSDAGM